MQLVKPSVQLLTLEDRLPMNIGLMKKIERCGRLAYRSEERITEDSYIRFINNLVKKEHTSVLEHGRILIDMEVTEKEMDEIEKNNVAINYPFIKTEYCRGYEESSGISIVGNLRALLEFIREEAPHTRWVNRLVHILYKEFTPIFQTWFLSNEKWLIGHAPTNLDLPYTIKEDPEYSSFHVITDRGVMAEWTRHRFNMSFTVESTRYCNYKKTGVTFCIPIPFDWAPSENGSEGQYMYDFLKSMGYVEERSGSVFYLNMNGIAFDSVLGIATNFHLMKLWLSHMEACERIYCEMLSRGCSPQEARAVLPNSLKSEFCVTGTNTAWEHFLKLRCAKDAHPQIRYLANQINVIMDHPIYSDSI